VFSAAFLPLSVSGENPLRLSMALEIEARDVIKIMLQFCKENSLNQTFQTLQSECQVSLNTVDSVETFISDINSGRWDSVLPQVSQLKLPRNKLEDLYEQIVLEMIELRELDTARAILRQTQVMGVMKQEQAERYLRMEHLLVRSYFDPHEVWKLYYARLFNITLGVAFVVAVSPKHGCPQLFNSSNNVAISVISCIFCTLLATFDIFQNLK
jgi:hypothetical protein